MPRKLTLEQFIEKAKTIYGNKYSYSNFKYVNYKTKGEIICKEHGSFFKTPEKFLVQKEKCPKCKLEEKIKFQLFFEKNIDYRKEYINLINESKNNPPKENYEIHHILPKSMFPKWKNRKSNLVKMSLKNHYKAHYLLYKIYNNKQMTSAFFVMLKVLKDKINPELYEEVRLNQKEKQSKKIYCYEDDIILNSLEEAKNKYNSSVGYALIKFSNSACLKHFCYLKDKEKAIDFWKNNIPKKGRPVYCFEKDLIFDTITEAAVELKCTKTKIIKACKTLKNTSGKCHWCYLEDKKRAIEFWKIVDKKN